MRPICSSSARPRSVCCACGAAPATATATARSKRIRILIGPSLRQDADDYTSHGTALKAVPYVLESRPLRVGEAPLDVHLVDGTYELFRHYYAVPPARD